MLKMLVIIPRTIAAIAILLGLFFFLLDFTTEIIPRIKPIKGNGGIINNKLKTRAVISIPLPIL